MVGTSLVLLAIAILFLRGQIRPILKLTQAAESFGKGQKMPGDFRPRGADEIRRAGLAFIQMRERIERQMEQRTAMLSGVSPDLRTILTRFRLQLALVGESPEIESLNKDVDDMQSMLDSYLSFARADAEEDVGSVSLSEIVERVATDGRLRGATVSVDIEGEDIVQIRPDAFNRMLTNLVANACRHADHVDITVTHRGKWLTILVDDDGPGIPADSREDVFRPFFRLDEARNQDESGTGLGLSIVRDIARSHGGDVTLSESPKKGLRAQVRLPV